VDVILLLDGCPEALQLAGDGLTVLWGHRFLLSR
jgi:hypothetical protein